MQAMLLETRRVETRLELEVSELAERVVDLERAIAVLGARG